MGKPRFSVPVIMLIFSMIILPVRLHAYACESTEDDAQEIFIELQVEKILVFDLDAYLCNTMLYLPVSELFSRLNIQYEFSGDRQQMDVDFPHEGRTFRFDLSRMRVRGPDGTIELAARDLYYPDDSGELHLRKEFLEKTFSLEIHFDYSSLRLLLSSEQELPVMRDHRRRVRYEYFLLPQNEFTADRELDTQRSLLDGWTLDWTLNTSNSRSFQNYSYGFTTAGQVLGGDLFVSSRGTPDYAISKENLRGLWRYPIYSTPVIRQVLAGDQIQDNIFSRGTLQFRGVEVTNRPNAQRHAFHQFTVSQHLKKGWDVELYTNNRMTGLARGDDKDLFSFSEPLDYGSNRYTLRYYSPDGYSHEETLFMTIPRTFLPPGSFQYSVAAGSYLNDSEEFARGQINMGISSFLTIGGGYHVRAQQSAGYEQFPYLNASLLLAKRLILEGSHTPGYTSAGSLQYYFASGRSLSADVRSYYQSSRYNRIGKNFEGSLNASFPINLGAIKLSTFVTARGIRYTRHQDLNLYGGFTAGLPYQFLLQLRSKTLFRDYQAQQFELVRSDISLTLSKRILRRVLLRPGLDYDHHSDRISGYRFEASSRLSRNGDFSLSLHHDQILGQSRLQFNFRYNFNFARYHSQARMYASGNPSFSQTLTGSLAVDTKKGDIYTDNRNQTGKASLRLEPYMVVNETGEKDYLTIPGSDLKPVVYINGREQPVYMDGDVVKNLIPYQVYEIRIDPDRLENPLWELESNTFRIRVIPHVMNRLPIPVITVGEVSGQIEITGGDSNLSLRGISIELKETGGSFSKTVETYSNGQFYYVGLKPGEYKAIPDPRQLSARSMNAIQDSVDFTIRATQNGDIVDGLVLEVALDHANSRNPAKDVDPVVEMKPKTIPSPPETEKATKEISRDSANEVTPEISSGSAEYSAEMYRLQVGAFLHLANAETFVNELETGTSEEADIFYDSGAFIYKCLIGSFPSIEAARERLHKLQHEYATKFHDAYIIRFEP